MKSHVNKRRCKDVDEWFERFKTIFMNLGKDGTVSDVTKSMPQRMKDIISAEGGATRW